MDKLGKYSFGIGDRFAMQGKYQLQAFLKAKEKGCTITPVWNKSYREHQTVHSEPKSVKLEADEAVKELGWSEPYFVDADHITMDTVDSFLPHSNFFTIDVANKINVRLAPEELDLFLKEFSGELGSLKIQGIDEIFEIDKALLSKMAHCFYKATEEASLIYRKIKEFKKKETVIIEVSMDEVEHPQSPLEMYFILRMLAENGVPVNTIAPKFTGRFNKGVDYEGDIERFMVEFEQCLLVIKHIVDHQNMPEDLKISVHTGSDKFSLYPIISKLIHKHSSGLHLKTAGTTWLEELIGLAEGTDSGLEMVKTIYKEALGRYEELTDPYATVLHINKELLPSASEVDIWSGNDFASALRHEPKNKAFNPNLRQLLHTAYKIAAECGLDFTKELEKNKEVIGTNVFSNLFDRHIKQLFLG